MIIDTEETLLSFYHQRTIREQHYFLNQADLCQSLIPQRYLKCLSEANKDTIDLLQEIAVHKKLHIPCNGRYDLFRERYIAFHEKLYAESLENIFEIAYHWAYEDAECMKIIVSYAPDPSYKAVLEMIITIADNYCRYVKEEYVTCLPMLDRKSVFELKKELLLVETEAVFNRN